MTTKPHWSKPIRTYVSLEEKAHIQALAKEHGVSEAAFLRWIVNCGLAINGMALKDSE